MKTILLIDSDPVSTIRISELVLRLKHRLVHAPYAAQAKSALRREEPDLVVHHLPENGGDSEASIQAAYEAFRLQGIPLLCIARAWSFLASAPEILGPKQYLNEPYTLSELLSTIEDHLQRGNRGQAMAPHSMLHEDR
jgi:DNA-binding NtrC family response regulator